MTKRAEDIPSFASNLAMVLPVPGPGETTPQEWYIRVYSGMSLGLRKPRPEYRFGGRFGLTKAVDIVEWCNGIVATVGQSPGTIWFEALTTGDSPSMIVWVRIYSEGDPDERRAPMRGENGAPAMNEHGAAAVMAHELVERSKGDQKTISTLTEAALQILSNSVDLAYLHGQYDMQSKIGGANASLAAKERAFEKLVGLDWPAILLAWKSGARNAPEGAAAPGADVQPESGNERVKWNLNAMSHIGQDLIALRQKDRANFKPEDLEAFAKMIAGAQSMIDMMKAGQL